MSFSRPGVAITMCTPPLVSMPPMQSIGCSSGYPRSCKTATNSSTTSNVCLASSRDGKITNPKGPSPGIIGIDTSSCKTTKIRGRTKTRVRIALGAARGLEYLHEAATPRVLHRDFKSSNILLDSKWRAKVADFGTAKTITSVDLNGQPSSPAKLLDFCSVILERKELESLDWSYSIVLLFLGFGLSMFAFYTLVPFLLKMTGATLFNLSLLTSDMWAVLIRIFFYHKAVDWLYYVAFAVVVVGLTIYSFYSDKVTTIVIENGPNETIPYTQLNEEREPNIPGIIVTPS